MEIISFRPALQPQGPTRFGAIFDQTYALDFAMAVGGGSVASDSIEWLNLDARWIGQAREVHGSLASSRDRMQRAVTDGWLVPLSDLRLSAPVPRPGKLVCIGLNYRDHAIEVNLPIPDQPVVFSKFTSAIVATGDNVVIPEASQQLDYEAELAIVIGRRTRNVSAARALDHVLGYTALNDVTARDFQVKDGQWQRSKSCDTFAPMGPAIVTTDVIPDPGVLDIVLTVNGETRQSSNTTQLIFSIPELIAYLSREVTLEPGDVIATGTPPGVGAGRTPPVFLQSGDVMTVEIQSIGRLTNPVVS